MNINIYKESSNEIPIAEATGGETDPILWCRDGHFCVIPTPVIKNAMNLRKSFLQTNLKRTPPVMFFVWSQGIPISNLAGRALIGE